MEDKMISYLIGNALATNKCLCAVEACQKALIKQAKINRVQRLINTGLLALTTICVFRISELAKIVYEQETKLDKLTEEETEGE